MNHLESLLRRAAALFDARKQAWALVGGLAVSVRTEPRFTRDLDLAVAVTDDKAAEDLVLGMQADGFRALATVEQEATKRLATARMAPFGDQPRGVILDLLFASSGIEAEVCKEAELLDVFPGLTVPVAQVHHLIALKVLSRDDRNRPQDANDLRSLICAAEDPQLTAARDACGLIESRGFNRSRDLVHALNSAWKEFRSQ